jgi:hypothetical protein
MREEVPTLARRRRMRKEWKWRCGPAQAFVGR